jgi:hypothetical protein
MDLMRKTPGMESAVAAIEKQLETLAANGQLTLKEAQALRQGIDKSINFNKAAPEMRGAQEGLYKQRTAIRDAMNEAINNLNPGAPKNALKIANRKYGNLSTAEDILEKEIGRNQANRAISLTDTIMAAGGPIAATKIALGVANKAGRTFGNSVQARVFDAISKKAGLVPGAADKINPALAGKFAARVSNASPKIEHNDNPILKDQKLMDMFKKDPRLIESIQDEKIKAQIKRALNNRGVASSAD